MIACITNVHDYYGNFTGFTTKVREYQDGTTGEFAPVIDGNGGTIRMAIEAHRTSYEVSNPIAGIIYRGHVKSRLEDGPKRRYADALKIAEILNANNLGLTSELIDDGSEDPMDLHKYLDARYKEMEELMQ
jgi:hypothetical protein